MRPIRLRFLSQSSRWLLGLGVLGCALCCAVPGLATLGTGATLAAALWSVTPPAFPSPESSRSITTAQGVVDLIAASPEVPGSGQETWLGIRFRLRDGWHIYWRNPGDSGGPPSVAWDVPSAVTPGEIQWPAPQRLVLSHLVNYGYTGDVVLPVRVQIQSGAGPREPIALTAHLRWLVCHDICVPGKATLRIRWPLAPDERGAVKEWQALIEAARAAVPRAAPPFWHATVEADRESFLVHVHPETPVAHAIFFPLEPAQIDDAAPQEVQSTRGDLRIRLRKSAQLVHVPDVLRGVLALPGRPAVSIEAPVQR